MTTTIRQYQNAIDSRQSEIDALRRENARLRVQVEEQQTTIDGLHRSIAYEQRVAQTSAREYQADIDALHAELGRERACVTAL